MKQKKFLTVMAVLDEETQARMNGLQQSILSLGLTGTQTMGIPFHISLGSYPPEKEADVLAGMRRTARATDAFPVKFTGLETFSDRVLFLKPETDQALIHLHQPFDSAYADGFPWTPHATLFCGDEADVRLAKKALEGTRFPICARVTALELGRFFPAEFIGREELLSGSKAGKEVCEP